MIFNDEEITDERIVERSKQVQKQIDAVRKARAVYEKLDEKLQETPKGATTRDKRKYRKCKWADDARAGRAVSTTSARSSSPKSVKRRLIEDDEGRGRERPGACSARSTRRTAC